VGEKEDTSTKTAKCVIELQKRMPLARVGPTFSNVCYLWRLHIANVLGH
jgi:hypothetical protein